MWQTECGSDTMADRQASRLKAPSAEDPEPTEVVRRLVDACDPLRIYLFGSVARGDAGADSDYDLVVIVSDEASRDRLHEDRGYRSLRGTGTAVELLVWPQKNFDRQLHLKASFPSTVLREGRLLCGVLASGDTLEAGRDELQEVLGDWLCLGLRLGHPIPELDGIRIESGKPFPADV